MFVNVLCGVKADLYIFSLFFSEQSHPTFDPTRFLFFYRNTVNVLTVVHLTQALIPSVRSVDGHDNYRIRHIDRHDLSGDRLCHIQLVDGSLVCEVAGNFGARRRPFSEGRCHRDEWRKP